MWWWGAGNAASAPAMTPPEAPEDKPLPWTPCEDCGAPMVDDEETSWPYCPICIDKEIPW